MSSSHRWTGVDARVYRVRSGSNPLLARICRQLTPFAPLPPAGFRGDRRSQLLRGASERVDGASPVRANRRWREASPGLNADDQKARKAATETKRHGGAINMYSTVAVAVGEGLLYMYQTRTGSNVKLASYELSLEH